jgi:S1-C subfamily serine protease
LNVLDLILVALLVAAAVGGYRLGFVTRALSWLGLSMGVFVASRLLPVLLRNLRGGTEPDGLLMVAIGVLVLGAFVGQVAGLIAGTHLQLGLRTRQARQVDHVTGAIAGALGVLVALWVVSPAMGSVPGWTARETRRSAIVREVNGLFPGAPDTARSMRQLLGAGYPEVFDALRPAPEVGPPPAASGLDEVTARRIAASTVKIFGQACSLEQEGSGFLVAPHLVATNAHVVAGERSTYVLLADGSQLRATPVAFDPERDIAILRVPGLDRPALPVLPSNVGQRGGVFGHPHGGPLTISPFQVGQKEVVTGTDIYGGHRTRRSVLFLASDLAPGDSGGALVTPQGQVVGVAFAIAPDKPGVSYALDTAELQAVLRTAGLAQVGTGGCVAD